jgi:putative (di)nucleoside polyphosphate hydrolase
MAKDLSLYRPNVGVVVFNARGQVWLGRRAGASGVRIWQFPQGGVDEGEDLEAAARRELEEETGITSVEVLGRTQEWLPYDFPKGYAGSKASRGWKGQRQIWFAVRFVGQEAEIDLEHHQEIEFDAWRWADIDEAIDLVVPFKRPAYAQVIAEFRPLARGLGG